MLDKLVGLLPQKMVVRVWKQLRKVRFLRNIITRCVNISFIAGVGGLVLDENGEMLIVKHTYKAIAWGMPSGALRREHPFKGLVREIHEETGFEVEPVRIFDVLYESKPDSLSIIVLAKFSGGTFIPSHEVSDYRWISPTDEHWLEQLPPRQQKIINKYAEENIL